MSAGQTHTPILTNRLYDALKWIAQIFLPGVATLYFTLAQIWGLPNAEEVVGTITAVDLFLGLLVGVSHKNYQKSDARFDGVMEVEETDDGRKRASFNVPGDPHELLNKSELTFKVADPDDHVGRHEA